MIKTNEDFMAYLSAATTAYVDCALWSSSCNSTADHDHAHPDRPEDCDVPLDDIGYDSSHLDPQTALEMRADVRGWLTFVLEHRPDALDTWDAGQFGHDFWLTRNGYGTGYWDRYYGDGDPRTAQGRWLTDHCKPYGSAYLYVGSDDRVYQGG